MKRVRDLRYFKSYWIAIFSFLLGCTITINLTPIDRTCRIEKSDQEYHIMENSKLKDPELVVLILSAPNNVVRRNVLRKTWLKLRSTQNADFKIKHYFVIGNLGLTNNQQAEINLEQSEFSDVLVLPMYDSYANLTEKVAKSFHWLNDQFDYGLAFKYVLKCDDDSFVRLDNLSDELLSIETVFLHSHLKNLNNLNKSATSPYLRLNLQINNFGLSNNKSLYWGYFSGNARIKLSGKWKEANWITCDRYTPYALGGGYIISKNLVSYIAKNVENLRFFNSEDISVGLWLSSVNNILRIHDIRFDTEWTSRGCRNFHLLTHNIPEKDMNSMYDGIITENKLCPSDIVKRHSYFYNWTVPPSQCCTKAII